jgi:voltage-gated potassium channel Kch
MRDRHVTREHDPGNAPRLVRILESRRLTARRALQLIALLTFAITMVGGLLAWLIDRNEFSSLGESLWWALQTVTTVGYGGVVPAETDGRVIGVILMLQGIGLSEPSAPMTLVRRATSLETSGRGRRRRGLLPERLVRQVFESPRKPPGR